jgi:short-subunit dehydrogenase
MSTRPIHVAITGASSGIGAALAEAYAEPGMRLSLAGRDLPRLEAAAERCRTRGAAVDVAVVDVIDPVAVLGWIEAADDRQPIDVVFANAGLGGQRAIAGRCGEQMADAQAIVATNLGGVVATAGAAISRFVPRRGGHVVLVGSIAGRIGLPHSPVYSATKAAVATYADGLRRLVAGAGVTVTLIEPGFVRTPMSQHVPGNDLMIWSVERAATRIRGAVAAKRAVLRFPLALDLLLHLARHLPRPIVDAILAAAHRRSSGS